MYCTGYILQQKDSHEPCPSSMVDLKEAPAF